MPISKDFALPLATGLIIKPVVPVLITKPLVLMVFVLCRIPLSVTIADEASVTVSSYKCIKP